MALVPQFLNSSNRPRAYARIVLVDEHGNEIAGNDQKMLVPTGANAWKSLSLTLEANQAGYAVIYVANESKMDVFFDEIEVSHERLVCQENAYYPFGLAIKPLEREGMPDHRFTYNGKELEETTGLLEFEARMHDPQTGRFHGIDPKAETYATWSPYVYAGNDPVRFMDVRGEGPWVNNGDGTYTAEKGDGAETLAKDAGISLERAYDIMEYQEHGAYTDENDGIIKSKVNPGETVIIPEQVFGIEEYELEISKSEGKIEKTEQESKVVKKYKGDLLFKAKELESEIALSHKLKLEAPDFPDEPKGGLVLAAVIQNTRRELGVKRARQKADKLGSVLDSLKNVGDSLKRTVKELKSKWPYE